MRKLTAHTLRATVLLAIVTVAMGGCDQRDMAFDSGGAHLTVPVGSISIYQLAGRLNMTVANSTPIMATLRDSSNVVLIYADPGGQAYVNGKPVGMIGGIRAGGGMLFVPGNIDRAIRPLLRARPAITVPLRPAPKQPVRRRIAKVVLDAGHGGKDTGAKSVRSGVEKTIVLDTTLRIARLLEAQNVEVILTRSTDKFITLDERSNISNRRKADLFVSIHADSAANRQARGYTVFVAPESPSKAARALANAIDKRMAAMGVSSRGVKKAYKPWRVLMRTKAPAVLIELGFLSNYSDARQLANPAHRQMLARGIAKGIMDRVRK